MNLFRFSKDFGARMVYPLTALFLETGISPTYLGHSFSPFLKMYHTDLLGSLIGNQTEYVPSAILCRLFTDPLMKLWDYDPGRLLASVPKMYAFSELREFYRRWRNELEKDKVQVYINTSVSGIRYQKNSQIEIDYINQTMTSKRLSQSTSLSSPASPLPSWKSWVAKLHGCRERCAIRL